MNFDEILVKAKDLVDVAAKKTGDVVEVSKLKFDALKINTQIKESYEKLGSAVYEMKQKDYLNEELISAICEEIEELKESLVDLYAEIADRQNINVCPVCSEKNSKESFYCSKCGAKLKEEFEDYSYSQKKSKECPTKEPVEDIPVEDIPVEEPTAEETQTDFEQNND